ncbi:MAG: TIGR00153 family protein [Thermotoga sp. 4484_232]|nr:TIGR00153 family protein [Thermotogaceae bacterium]OQX58142.1 MAG: TIGR00153 family protein [Thermotoga sp. 4484_232]RKX40677.1 MAG: TIGR00153 family protein [Thermotogota bacterium]RKX53577.1 MAG: TIGR00153 family protein [Thermotoga sp.]RKX57164.1 MAG: TIGR00153 family protein [Thermotoga sp.]
MWIFGKKEEKIIELIKNHLDLVEKTIESLRDYLEMYFSDGEKATVIYEKIQTLESDADRIRRKVETDMYSGAFLPNFRGDLLGLIESVDKIANKAEFVADLIELQHPVIPNELKDGVLRQIDLSLETFRMLKRSIEFLFEDLQKAGEYVILTEKREHEEDEVERGNIKKLFELDIERCAKLELKEIIRSIGDIADRAEDSSDRVEIIILKRRV